MTTINFSTNCSISFPVIASAANRIKEEVRLACRIQEAEINNWDKGFIIDEALFRFGIGTEISGIYNPINVDTNGNRWLTPIAELISRGTRCYDWSDYGIERTAGIEPAEDEFLCSFGGAHYGYKTVMPLNNWLPVEAREYFSALAERYYNEEVELAKAELFASRKAWGQKQNEELRAVGCSKTDIHAWWNMSWKKEWCAPDWRKFCQYSDEQISAAMAGESGAYFEAVLGRTWHGSVPRTKDAVYALGKARGLKKKYWRDWKRGGTMITHSKVEAGCRVWNF